MILLLQRAHNQHPGIASFNITKSIAMTLCGLAELRERTPNG